MLRNRPLSGIGNNASVMPIPLCKKNKPLFYGRLLLFFIKNMIKKHIRLSSCRSPEGEKRLHLLQGNTFLPLRPGKRKKGYGTFFPFLCLPKEFPGIKIFNNPTKKEPSCGTDPDKAALPSVLAAHTPGMTVGKEHSPVLKGAQVKAEDTPGQ